MFNVSYKHLFFCVLNCQGSVAHFKMHNIHAHRLFILTLDDDKEKDVFVLRLITLLEGM